MIQVCRSWKSSNTPKPYLVARSLAGTLMTTGHVAFAILIFRILHSSSVPLVGPTLFTTTRGEAR
jgi:cytochrome c oxidase cbb3-type subunit 1